MNKKFIAASAACMALAFSGVTLANKHVSHNSKYYVGFYTAMTAFNADTDAGKLAEHGYKLNAFGFQAGMNFMPFRVGVNLASMNDVMSASVEGTFFLPLSKTVAALATAGVGYGMWRDGAKNTAGFKSENHMVYNVGVGLTYKLNKSTSLYGAYNYLGYSVDKDKGDKVPKGFYNAFVAGVTIRF